MQTHTHTDKQCYGKDESYIPPTFFICPGYNILKTNQFVKALDNIYRCLQNFTTIVKK